MHGIITVPNTLTASRILVSLIILIGRIQNLPFLLLFLYAGLSDMADGYFARRHNCQTELGAKLDSFADIFMFGVVFQRCYRDVLNSKLILYWSLAILITKIGTVILLKIRFHILGIVHTMGNKILGILLFSLPFWGRETREPVLSAICFFASAVVLEEIAIIVTSRKININRKSILG